jgi:hypothetical protein
MPWIRVVGASLGVLVMLTSVYAYPIDGYATTGIRRLELLRLRVEGTLQPTFKGVWLTAANFAPLLLPDTKPGQCPRPHK